MSTAVEVFRKRTGTDPTTDPRLATLMRGVLGGLDENRATAGERREAREGAYDVEWVPTQTARGRTPLPRNLTVSLQALVEWLGPADAALALLIFRLHTHPAFICARGGRKDVRDLLRYLERRLVQISGKQFDRPSAEATGRRFR